jgi:hypothetical protein
LFLLESPTYHSAFLKKELKADSHRRKLEKSLHSQNILQEINSVFAEAESSPLMGFTSKDDFFRVWVSWKINYKSYCAHWRGWCYLQYQMKPCFEAVVQQRADIHSYLLQASYLLEFSYHQNRGEGGCVS